MGFKSEISKMVQGYIKASGYIACAKEDIYVACW